MLHHKTTKINSVEEFNQQCAEVILSHIRSSDQSKKVVIGLSGGSTPVPIYERVSKAIINDGLSLENVIFFMVDDRYVPSNHKDSNIRLVNTTLLTEELRKLTKVNTIFPRVDELNLHECVADFDDQIKNMIKSYGKADLVTLGLGPDGHTASLFPEVINEAFDRDHLVVHTTTDKFAVRERLGVNIGFLENHCDNYAMFLKGKDKGVVWDDMISDLSQKSDFDRETVKRWPVANLLRKPTFHYILADV